MGYKIWVGKYPIFPPDFGKNIRFNGFFSTVYQEEGNVVLWKVASTVLFETGVAPKRSSFGISRLGLPIALFSPYS
jgi:hypothetical protein